MDPAPQTILHIAHKLQQRSFVEDRLRHQEDQKQLALELAQLAEWDWDIAQNTFTWNDSLFTMLGYPPGSIVPSYEAWACRVHPDDLQSTVAQLQEAMEGGGDYHPEYRVLWPNGTIRYLQALGRFNRASDGHPIRSYGVLIDLTDRKQQEGELFLSEMRYRTLVDFTSAVTWSCPSNGLHTKPQPRWMAFTGQTADEMLGAGWTTALHPDDAETSVKAWSEAVAKGKPFSIEHRIRRHDGQWRWMSVYVVPVLDSKGEILEWFGMNLDITDRKRNEEERLQVEAKLQQTQKLEGLGVLAAGIAHDFNNILALISGFTSLAIHELSPESPARSHLEESINGIQKGAELTKQLMAYAGNETSSVEAINLNTKLRDMTRFLQIAISKKCRLNFCLTPELPLILANRVQLRQIILNLVMNASEAIGDCGGLITVTTGFTTFGDSCRSESYLNAPELEGTYVFFDVSDSGIGMTKEILAQIFTPFFTTKSTGRGLGLSALRASLLIQFFPGLVRRLSMKWVMEA